MSDMKNVGDGTTFSMRQMIGMLSAATILSGGGAAIPMSDHMNEPADVSRTLGRTEGP